MNSRQLQELDYCTIFHVGENIYELVFHPEIEVTRENIIEITGILEEEESPRYLLVNKKYPFSYSFEAILEIYKTTIFDAVAVIALTSSSRIPMDFFLSPKNRNKTTLKYFVNFDQAIDWLRAFSVK